ncbi:MAG: hypothetical protein OEM02_10260 [Desulfobulbaceae bacterium]|nr:hypothetical protein [Desulfobulbaceae bacterium]
MIFSTIYRTIGLCGVIFLGGCVAKTPALIPLSPMEARSREEAFHDIVEQTCPVAVDADIRLRYNLMGKELSWPGTLQMQEDRFIYRAIDPLGRPLFMVSANDAGFTLVENQDAMAYSGEWDCGLRHRYLPGKIKPKDVVLWLSGRLSTVDMSIRRVGMGSEGDCCWFVVDYNDSMTHYVHMDLATGQVSRHLLYDATKDEIELEIGYSNYSVEGESCQLPGKIILTGSGLTGEAVISLERVYSRKKLPEKVFRVVLPEYFQVEEVK